MSENKQPRIVAQKPYVNVKVLEVAAHVVGAVNATNPGDPSKGVVERAIDSILTGRNSEWGPTSRRFEDADALAIFPVHGEVGSCILADFNVER